MQNKENFRAKIENVKYTMVKKCKNLGLIIDNKLNFSDHLSYILQKSYPILKILYMNRYFFNTGLKLCDSIIMTCANYCIIWTSPYFRHSYRLQIWQSSCLRFTYGIQKFENISHTKQQTKWINMKNIHTSHTTPTP